MRVPPHSQRNTAVTPRQDHRPTDATSHERSRSSVASIRRDRHDAAPNSALRSWGLLIVAWTPVWVVYSILAHVTATEPWPRAILIGARAVGIAALLGVGVWRLSGRRGWPERLSLSFGLTNLRDAVLYAALWVFAVELIEALIRGETPFWAYWTEPTFAPRMAIGFWLYIATAGVSHAIRSVEELQSQRERAARAEAEASQAQLAALRGQLRPHFLFNALNSIASLLGEDVAQAERALELLATILRAGLEETRPLVPLKDELRLVHSYLDFESLRFGDRIVTEVDVSDDLGAWPVPAFGLQTLVENAVRHGASPKLGTTRIVVSAESRDGCLTLRVFDDGVGCEAESWKNGSGLGLRGLGQRLAAQYEPPGRLDVRTRRGEGFTATLLIPAAPLSELT